MKSNELFKTEIYEFAGGYVACAVNRSNNFVLASSKPFPTQQQAKEAFAAKLTLVSLV